MAPAAADTIYQSFIDFEMESVDFDRIILEIWEQWGRSYF